MNNEHEIRSLQDILRAVNSENQENFLKDLDAYLSIWTTMKAIIESTPPRSRWKRRLKARSLLGLTTGSMTQRSRLEFLVTDRYAQQKPLAYVLKDGKRIVWIGLGKPRKVTDYVWEMDGGAGVGGSTYGFDNPCTLCRVELREVKKI